MLLNSIRPVSNIKLVDKGLLDNCFEAEGRCVGGERAFEGDINYLASGTRSSYVLNVICPETIFDFPRRAY